MPPRRVRSAAARSELELQAGQRRSRASAASGRRARTPRPEQGASTSARSKPDSSSSRTSALTTRTFRTPSRRTFSSSSRARPGCSSTAVTSPFSIVALAPGSGAGVEDALAVARAERERGELRAAALPDHAAATGRSPRARRGRRRGRRSARRSGPPSARRARPARSGRASARAPPPRPSRAPRASWIQSGYDSASGPGGSAATSAGKPSARRRATAFVKPVALREAGGADELDGVVRRSRGPAPRSRPTS